MTEINDKKYKILETKKYTFTIDCDTRNFSTYSG